MCLMSWFLDAMFATNPMKNVRLVLIREPCFIVLLKQGWLLLSWKYVVAVNVLGFYVSFGSLQECDVMENHITN